MLNARDSTSDEVTETGLVYRVFRPEEWKKAKNPLVVLIHGRTGEKHAMWVFAKAFGSCRPVIVSPQGPFADPAGGFRWWSSPRQPPGSCRTLEEHLVDISMMAEPISRFIERCVDLYNVDSQGIVAVGFSQGGAVASTVSLLSPGLLQGVALLSAFIPTAVMRSCSGQAMQTTRTKYFVAHGRNDPCIPIERAEAGIRWLKQQSFAVESAIDASGHKVGPRGINALAHWYRTLFTTAGHNRFDM